MLSGVLHVNSYLSAITSNTNLNLSVEMGVILTETYQFAAIILTLCTCVISLNYCELFHVTDQTSANIADRPGHLSRLQHNLNTLHNKLSRTSLSLQTLLDAQDYTLDCKHEIKGGTSNTNLEDKVHDRSLATEEDTTEVRHRMVSTVGTNDSNKPSDKVSGNSSEVNNRWKTCDFWSLPKWLQDNNYVLKGYRPELPSFFVCTCSIFRIHTETINIWTHLLGCLLFVVLAVHTSFNSLSLEDKLVLSPFFAGAVLCLWFSATFHTLHCHSQWVSSIFGRLDYCGINLLITGSFIPWLYYAFYCETRLKILYLTGVLILGICATVLSLSKTFSQPFYRPMRATVFVIFGLCGIVPGAHFILLDGWDAFITFTTPLLITAVLYILGAVIYAMRIPERLFPGKCDILFQSHQFFHVLVVIATAINYHGLIHIAMFAYLARNNADFCLERNFYYRKHIEQYF